MPQCKRSDCREPAVYNRRWGYKHYCEAHGHAYADRRDAAPGDISHIKRVFEEAAIQREEAKRRELQNADTVDALRNWIEEYLL